MIGKTLPLSALALAALFLFFPIRAAAQVTGARAAEAGGGRVSGVSVAGLRRTRPHVAEQPLRKFIGMDANSVNTEDVYAAILAMGILTPIEIFFADDPGGPGKILVAVVEEKWTFFPVPIVIASQDTASFGLGLMDSNAFGLNDKMILMGMYSLTGSWTATALYMATPDRDRGIGWQIMGFYSDQSRVDTDQKRSVIRQFNVSSAGGGLGINYSFNSFLTAGLSAGVQNHMLRETADPVEMPGQGILVLGIVPSLSARRTEWDGYFLSEQGVSVNYTFNAVFDAPSFHSVSLSGAFAKSIIPGFRADIRAGVIYAPGAPVLSESPPSGAKVDILPSTFSARNYAGISAGLEKHLFKFGFGTLSVAAAYQALWSQGPILGHQFDHGPAGGIRLYLSRIALPAMGLGAAYNVRADLFQGTFTIGMSF
ncbi:MAG: hypothetical protein LBI91_05955 [Spirochaetaceae bacterium]|jgi:outer membrane protein assembly factor BamA|nr:hypothetical protein [Spirochaetaceae bacterium]